MEKNAFNYAGIRAQVFRLPVDCSNQFKIIYSRKAEPLGDIRRSFCEEGDVGRLYSSVVRAFDRQSKDLGSNPSAIESVFFHRKISNSLKFVLLNTCRIVRSFLARKKNGGSKFQSLNLKDHLFPL